MATRTSAMRLAPFVLLLLGIAGCMSRDRFYPAFYDSLQTRQRLVDAPTARGVGDDRAPTYAQYEADRRRRANDLATE